MKAFTIATIIACALNGQILLLPVALGFVVWCAFIETEKKCAAINAELNSTKTLTATPLAICAVRFTTDI